MKYALRLQIIIFLMAASCADIQSRHETPPYGDLRAKLPQKIEARVESPEIFKESSMTEIFLSLGFYEASYSELKTWINSKDGRKHFKTTSISANLAVSPHGSVIIRRTSNDPIQIEATVTTESGTWNYKIKHSAFNNKWIIESIDKITKVQPFNNQPDSDSKESVPINRN